jgi:hypothetical protein
LSGNSAAIAARPQVTALAHAAVLVVLAAGGLEFGEVHIAGEDPSLLGGQCRVVGTRLVGIADKTEALGEPGDQFAFVSLGDLAPCKDSPAWAWLTGFR